MQPGAGPMWCWWEVRWTLWKRCARQQVTQPSASLPASKLSFVLPRQSYMILMRSALISGTGVWHCFHAVCNASEVFVLICRW